MPKKKIAKTAANSFPHRLSLEYKGAELACLAEPDKHPQMLFLAVKNSNGGFKNTKLSHNAVVQMIAGAKQEAREFCRRYLDYSKMKNYDSVFSKIDAIFESMKQEPRYYGKVSKSPRA